MQKLFRIRASQAHKIMGRIGITDKQKETVAKYLAKDKLTENQSKELLELQVKAANTTLPETCTTYLKEWYANDNEKIYSKQMNKGINVEDDLIDFMAICLGFGLAEKNRVRVSDEYMEGECDVDLPSCIVDVKAPWNKKTLHDSTEGLDKGYETQLIVYCHLYKKPKGILFYGLMNTPETDWSEEIVYDDFPINERWHAYTVNANPSYINEIIERVKLCRTWLENYDIEIKGKLGRIN